MSRTLSTNCGSVDNLKSSTRCGLSPNVRQIRLIAVCEPPWVWWRLVLLVSNPGGVGLLGSVERCFELGRRDVTAVAVKAVLVEPVHPRQGGQLELVDVVPVPRRVGPVDALGLVEPVRRLGQRVDAPI